MPRALRKGLQSATIGTESSRSARMAVRGGAGMVGGWSSVALFAPGRCLSCRAPGPPVCARLRSGAGAARRAALRPLRAARRERDTDALPRVPGRRLAFASARGRRRRSRGRPTRSCGPGRTAGCAAPPTSRRSSCWRWSSRRPAPSLLVPVPALRGPGRLARRRRRAWRSPSGSADAWQLEVAVPLRRDGGRPQRGLDRDDRRRNARAQFRAVARRRRAASCWSTTSTPRAPRPTSARACCAGPAPRRVDVVTFARAGQAVMPPSARSVAIA